MTPILSHLIALFVGLLIATLILWYTHRKQQKDWQAEYRRLMDKIFKARRLIRLKGFTFKDEVNVKGNLDYAYKVLSDAYGGINNVR